MNIIRTAVLLTVFNRRETTLIGLKTLQKAIARLGDGYAFDIFLVDDGSTDGTRQSVEQSFPDVKVYVSPGDLYWGGGMNMAWQKAVAMGQYDYYLWYNDDSDLYEDALITLYQVATECQDRCVVTGAFCDHQGQLSYGGGDENEHGIAPNGKPQPVKTMNGNLVLIPNSIYQTVGMIDSHYIHSFGDHDYGYRVQKQGNDVLLTPRYVGVCDNHHDLPFKKEQSLSKRWRSLHSPKNRPSIGFRYLRTYKSWNIALRYLISSYIYVFFPSLMPNSNKE